MGSSICTSRFVNDPMAMALLLMAPGAGDVYRKAVVWSRDSRGGAMRAIAMILALCVVLACTDEISLAGRPCPCAQGWICCGLVCARDAAECGEAQITPRNSRLRLGATQRFSAPLPVTWLVDEPDGGNIDADGLYHAPLRPGTYHVSARNASGGWATTSVIVGPSELTALIGMPGGRGTADGVGPDARFYSPGAIVGDADFLYVTDDSNNNGGVGPFPCAKEKCSSDNGESYDLSCVQKHCMRPSGVRRIARFTGEVSWLVSDRTLRQIAIDGGDLFAATSALRLVWFGFSAPGNLREIVKLDRSTGAVSAFAGLDEQATPRDGVGANARFEAIVAMAGDGTGALYVIDREPSGYSPRSALRRIDVKSGAVTTLLASPGWPGDAVAHAPMVFPSAVAVHDDVVFVIARLGEDGTDEYFRQTIWRYDTKTGSLVDLEGWSIEEGVRDFCFDRHGVAVGIFDTFVEPVFAFGWGFGDSTAGSADGYPGSFGALGGIWCDPESSIGGLDGADKLAPAGAFYVADTGNGTIRKLAMEGIVGVETIAGQAPRAAATGNPDIRESYVALLGPSGISTDSGGNVVFRNGESWLVRMTPDGALSARDLFPWSARALALSPDGSLYFAGQGVKQLDFQTGSVSPLLELYELNGLAHDGQRLLYFSHVHFGERRIERTDVFGTREVVATGYSGPLAIDGSAQLFVAHQKEDGYPSRELFRVELFTGEVHALPSPDDGWEATALAYEPAGVLYVAEASRQRVRGLVIGTGEIFDVVGRRGQQGVKLGPLPGGVNVPSGIALLPDGSLAITDSEENVVVVAR
jgi:hypothetical protein